RKALIGYPGETPTLNATNADRGVAWGANYSPYGRYNYFTFAKLRILGGTQAFGIWGDYVRVVGNSMEDMRADAWTGVVMVDNSQQIQVLGNLFKNCGYDSYKHNVYIKTHANYVTGDKSIDYVTVGWNEFDSPYAGSDNRGGAIFVSRASDSGSKNVDHIYVHSNYFHGGNMEHIYTGDTTPHNGDIWIYNNILRENTNGSGGMYFAWGTRNVYLYNNTFYGLTGGGVMMAITGTAQVISRNNIYRSLGAANVGIETYQGATFNSQNDLYYGATVPSGGGITVSGAKTTDPLFVSASDLSLQANSTAINAGLNTVSSYVVNDYNGIGRPQGAGYDLGAFEYGSGGGTTPPPPGDTTAPSVPANLSATAVSTSQINLSWSASSDAVGVSGYRVYRNGTQINTTANTSYSDTGLSASTSYTYSVAAYDAAGNVSSQSSSVSGTTQTQVVLPVISNLTGSNTTATTTRISWDTNVATNGQVFYGLTSSYGQQSTVVNSNPRTTSHTVTLSNLTPSTFYHFQVRSIDASNNTVTSSDFTFTTLAAPLPPSPVISFFTASPTSITSGQSSTLTWSVSNATSLSVNQGVGTVTGSSRSVSPTVTTTYTLTATGAGGTATAQVTVTVGGGSTPTSTPPVIASFTASNESIVAGDSTALSWTITGNPTPTVSISGGVGTPAGSLASVSPTVTTTYTLTATNSAGSATAQLTVSVTPFSGGSGGGGSGGGGSGGGGSGGTISTSTPGTIVFIPPMSTPGIKEIISAVIRLINIDGTYYLIKNNQRFGITNPGMLSSYGFTFIMAKEPTAEDLALPDGPLLTPGDGSLVKSKEDPTIYLISKQKRYAFTSAKVFLSLGHKWSSVLTVTNPELQVLLKGDNLNNEQAAHLPGTDIVVDGTIYWIGEDNMLHGYPSLEVYNSWHIPNDFTKVVKANAADQLMPIGELVTMRVLE
ncbi:MAG: fibronectin type III domain-containing protein, partial [Elusimicrobiota bacterium]